MASTPTVVVSFADGSVFSVSHENIKPGDPFPKRFRVIVRNYDRGNEPDEHGDLYEDEEII